MDHAETGNRVASALKAAEEAAGAIRVEERHEADEILRHARLDASARVEELDVERRR